MMFLMINITLIFSLNHLEKHRMKCFKKSSKISKNECIPPVYHLCITCMGKLKMKHLPHDGRHSFASLMVSAGANDVCIKLIMGHSMKNDTTKGTYTHKTLEELLTEVNKI